MVVQQLKLMLKRRGFWIALTVNMALVLINAKLCVDTNLQWDVTEQWAPTENCILQWFSPLSDYIASIYIFVLLFPYAFSFSKDRKTGLGQIIINKVGRRRYYFANLAACFVGTLLAFAIPLLIGEAVNEILFPNKIYYDFTSFYNTNLVHGSDIFKDLYAHHPHIYNMLYIMLVSSIYALLAVFVYSISLWIRCYNILLLLPAYMLSQVLDALNTVFISSDYFFCIRISDYILINRTFGETRSWGYLTALCMLLLAVSVLLTMIKSKRDQLNL